MTDAPSPHLLSRLNKSPISTLFVLTNIDQFVRDFTRCYYQLPPGLADPSAFHIFTQSQNRQINAALQHITHIIAGRDPAPDGSDRPIWSAIERMNLSIKISLCKPDDLLVGGIVDSSVVAGLATATHLTLGLYAGSRRSLQSLLQHNFGDDAVLMILDEAMDGLASICRSDRQDALREAPWTTVSTYRILLAIWRSLRWAASQVRGRSGSTMQEPYRRGAAGVIYSSIMEVVLQQERHDESPDMSETYFTRAVLHFWKERSVWALGASMTTVLEDIITSGY
ncbi:hypothetical protein G7046_g4973 [Stylonectria norvegica]|nr:hypothetical protein G7046_g4973 [Stylonectria norvegica]